VLFCFCSISSSQTKPKKTITKHPFIVKNFRKNIYSVQ
jgi:hypothetical protein